MKKITLAGICCDHNSTFMRGPAAAPEHIRRVLYGGSCNLTAENGLHFKDILHEDLGNIHIDESEESFFSISDHIASNVDHTSRILVMGGDHSITYPVVRALAAIHGPLALLHFDAHPDLYNKFRGNPYSHACPFARIMEEKLASRLVQVGIRTMNSPQAKQAAKYGVEVHEVKDCDPKSLNLVFDSPLYISLDLDALDPAFAPGVSHHEPGGLSTREILDIISRIKGSIVGGDIVEYNPDRDIHDMTAMVAAKFVKELAAKMAENEEQ